MMRVDTALDSATGNGLEAGAAEESSAGQGNVSVQNGRSVSGAVRKKRFGLRIAFVTMLLALAGGILGQFLYFAHQISTAKVPNTASADAIVVLTGGQARVREGLRLLEEGHADRLLISGVHPGTTREQLAVVTSSTMPLEKASVDLDRVALNTAGNAMETAVWVQKNGFNSLLVVTSAYHIPRAKAELSDVLPDVDLIAYPVFAKGLDLDTWYRKPATIRLLMREYVKYILARLRNTVRAMN